MNKRIIVYNLQNREEIPLFRKVIIGDTTLQKEVLSFYDINSIQFSEKSDDMRRFYVFNGYNPNKKNIFPDELLTVLDFGREIYYGEWQSLEYVFVRNKCAEINKYFELQKVLSNSDTLIQFKKRRILNPLDKLYHRAIQIDNVMDYYRMESLREKLK